MVQILRVIGRIPALNNVQMSKCMSIAVAGVIGYYGRSTPLSMADCKAIEGARAVAMQQRGFSPSVPHLQIYANARDGGLQHEHAYRVAAAAVIDQIDRALCGAEGEPHRAAVKSAIVGACRRLGCRGYSPLEWSPEHLRHELSEDNVIEAWLLAKLRTGIRAVVTRATPADADVTGAMGGDGWRSRGPRLWEADDERTVGGDGGMRV